MPVFDEDYGQDTGSKPGTSWGKLPEMEDSPINKALLTGFDAIGQPYHDQPEWRKSQPEPEAPDFNTGGYQMPIAPDTSDMYELGKTNQAFTSDRSGNFLGVRYADGTNQTVSSQRVSNALGANWENDNSNKDFADFLSQVGDVSQMFRQGRRDSASTTPPVQSSAPKVEIQTAVVKAAPATTPAKNPYPVQLDDELVRQTDARATTDVLSAAGQLAKGMVKNNWEYGTHVMHGDPAAQGLVNVYQSDPVRFSSDSAAPRIANENTPLEIYRENIEARGAGILEDGEHLYQGFNIKKDEFTLGLMQLKLMTDSIMAKVDPHFVPDNNLVGRIEDLRNRIAEGKKPDPVQENRDLGDILRSLRKGFWKDAVGQKLVDAGIFLTTRNVSLGVEGVYQAVKTMSEVHANDALANGGEGSLLRAFDIGGGAAMKIGAFNKYMQVLGRSLSGPHKLLLDIVVDNMSEDMKQRVVDRARRREVQVPTNRR